LIITAAEIDFTTMELIITTVEIDIEKKSLVSFDFITITTFNNKLMFKGYFH